MQKINFTMVPNEIIDEHLKDLTGAELKVLMAISRKTIGWHKETDWICNQQMMNITGLSEPTVIKAVKSLKEKRLITQEKVGKRGHEKLCYELDFDDGVKLVSPGGKESLPGGLKNFTHKINTTKETIQKKEQYAPSVNMTEAQYVTLIYDYGHGITAEAIEKLSIYKQAKGKKYTSDYHAILNWVIDEVAGKKREEIKALRNAEREKRKGQRETMRLIDTDKLEQRLTPAETKEFIKGIAGKMPTV